MTKLTKPTIQKESKASAALAFAEEASKVAPKAEQTPPPKRVRNPYAPVGHRRMTINLPEELHKKLRLAALERDTTAKDIIEDLLKKELGA